MSNFFEKKLSNIKGNKLFILLCVILVVYLIMKYISPLITPFLLSFCMVAYLYPRLDGIHKKTKMKKSFLTGVILFLLFILLSILIWWLGSKLFIFCGGFIKDINIYEQQFECFVENCCMLMQNRFGIDGIKIENFIVQQVDIFIENLEIQVMPKIMGQSFIYIKNVAGAVSFIVVMVISTLLLIKDYDKIINITKNNESFRSIWDIGVKVLIYIKMFLKAQLIIMTMISVICAAALWMLGIKNGVVIGAVIGFMDMLPFIGTGIILIPMAIFQLLSGSYIKAIGCLILYAACAFIREFLEPKLIGNKVGIWPVAILFSVYVGIHLFGIFGIIKGPIAVVVVIETYRYLMTEGSPGEEAAGSC